MQPTVTISSILNAPTSNPIETLEKKVETMLDKLQASSILQPQNRIAIKELINLIDKIECLHKSTDKDICKVVLDAQQAAEDALINGRDDDIDNNADKPTNAFL
ncbi:hypothetical protein H0H87_001949 [Tephrocybe sp. NHM501043]|nr:hypothetical protein H0H87_001949 [Tephrocybe sp. NHM501043]